MSFYCLDCKGTFDEPETHRSHGDPDAGESYWVIEEFCPNCSSDSIVEIQEDEEFRRDQISETQDLTRKTG